MTPRIPARLVACLPRLLHARSLWVVLFLAATFARGSEGRQNDLFDYGWRFQLGTPPSAEKPEFDDSTWRTVDLPHDWSIEGPYDPSAPTGGPGGYLPTGIGWYRKSFLLPEGDRGRRVSVQFDGVYEHSTVWINGHEAGTRPYGYSSFIYDLTPYVTFGSVANVIAVRVDNSLQPNSRWYSGSGIFRHTWLRITDPLHVAPWGVYVTTPNVSPESATVAIRTHLINAGASDQRFELRTQVVDDAGNPIQEQVDGKAVQEATETVPEDVAGGDEHDVETKLVLRNPRLWAPGSPTLYRVRSEILSGGEVVDSTETVFGVRRVEFDVDRGMLINGSPVKIRGMCMHHDGGAVGAAVPEAVLERRLRLLQEMGCNAIRCSHNPEAPEFYDLCDRLGLLVLDEAFDEWTIRKPQIKFGYSDSFDDWFARDLVDFVHRDRSHPCVVMWSAGNEIGEQGSPTGPDVLRKIVEVFHREDPTRPVTAAMDNIFNQNGEAPDAFTEQLDIVGYNYADRWGARRETQYTDDREHYPRRRFLGTEESTVAGARGDYRFGSLLDDNDSDDELLLGKGPVGALYVASTIRAASLWRFAATHGYVIGEFMWTGFDYLGESRWPRKSSYFGALDSCGFKKDAFYFYQSLWTEAPMIHLLPHWNWPGRVGSVVPVVAYSNCAAVELFLNGRPLGVKAKEFPSEGVTGAWNTYDKPKIHATTDDMQFVWDVVYEPGELKAVGYDRTGAVVATEILRTAHEAAVLEATVDRPILRAGARDVANVTVRALDADGTFVPLADNAVTFELTGPGRLIGVDNGDPESHASYQGTTRALFKGMALALVQSTTTPGAVTLTARSPGLREASVTISTGTNQ